MSSSRVVENGESTTALHSPAGKSASRGSNKRGVDEAPAAASPVRRSKRFKSSDAPDSSQTTRSGTRVKQEEAINQSPRSGVSKKKQANPEGTSLKTALKEEKEEAEELSVDVSSKKAQQDKEKPDEKTTVTAKISRKRKTKEEKDIEMQPLAARTTGLRMFVGAHVSAAKGIFNAVNNSAHVGGNAFALFLKSQRKWDNPALQDDHRDQFRARCLEHKYDASKHILPHGSYLVNLAQEDKAKAKQAYNAFLDDLQRCEALGINLYNFHPGSANQTPLPDALSRLAQALTNALNATSTVTPVLETMCGHGTTIGGSLSEFRDLLALIPTEHHSRIGICIDTCHSFSAGYDLVSREGWQAFMQEFDELIGLKYLRALHLNDSKAPRGSKRDLHANIGTGFLGLRAFHNVMNEPRLEGLPMILETPIDRPVIKPGSSTTTTNGTAPADEEEKCESEVDADADSDSQNKKEKKKKPTKARKPASAKQATEADPSVWAREIKLLESLIGMDSESDEFRRLEAGLAEEGREMREKHQEQYERKLATEEKKKSKADTGKKGQKTLEEMMKGPGKKGNKKRKASESGSENDT